MSRMHYREESMSKTYFSPAEVAQLLGVTRETIYNGIKSGVILVTKLADCGVFQKSRSMKLLEDFRPLLSDNSKEIISAKSGNLNVK